MLFLVDPIDEVAIQNLKSYKEKNFIDISKEDLDLGRYIYMCVSVCVSYLIVFFCLAQCPHKSLELYWLPIHLLDS